MKKMRKAAVALTILCVVFTNENLFSMRCSFTGGLWNYFTDGPKKLHSSILRKDKEEVERLLRTGVDPNSFYKSKDRIFASLVNMTPDFMSTVYIPSISLAVMTENFEVVKLLAKSKANIDLKVKVKAKGVYKMIEGPTTIDVLTNGFPKKSKLYKEAQLLAKFLVEQQSSFVKSKKEYKL